MRIVRMILYKYVTRTTRVYNVMCYVRDGSRRRPFRFDRDAQDAQPKHVGNSTLKGPARARARQRESRKKNNNKQSVLFQSHCISFVRPLRPFEIAVRVKRVYL